MNQFIIFNDNGVVLDAHFTDSFTIDETGQTIYFQGGSILGPNGNYGLLENGVMNKGDVLPVDQTLAICKQTKISELNTNCANCIYNGFDCQPLGDGTTYHFPFDDQAQANYNQYLTDVLCGSTDSESWKVQDSNGNWMTLSITPDQFKNNVRPVASSFKKAQIDQYRSLVSQVENATDIPTIKAVVWSSVSY